MGHLSLNFNFVTMHVVYISHSVILTELCHIYAMNTQNTIKNVLIISCALYDNYFCMDAKGLTS